MLRNPLVSVIVPTFNEEKFIGRTLDSFLNQDYPNYEIIVVDGNSTDKTLEIVRTYSEKFPEKVRVFSEPDYDKPRRVIMAKPAFARRFAVKISRGDVILHFLGHASADKNLISVLMAELKRFGNDVACVGCVDKVHPECNSIAKIIYSLRSLGRRTPKKDQFVNHVWFAVYRKKIIEEFGGFPLGGDCELNILITRAGYRKYFTVKTIVFNYWHPKGEVNSFISFFRRMFIYGNARAWFFKKYPKHGNLSRYFLLAMLSLFLGYGFGFFSGLSGLDARRHMGL